MRSPSPNHRRVAVLVDTSTAWGRRVIEGVLSYTANHDAWDVWLEPRGQDEKPRLPTDWRGDGVIARVATHAIARRLEPLGIPVVNVSGIRLDGVGFPRVCTDNDRLAEVAVSHFVDRGLRNVGYIGLPGRTYSMERQEAMSAAASRAGCGFSAYRVATKLGVSGKWSRDRKSVGIWLQSLPKPIGILAWGVKRGTDVVEQAIAEGFAVPDQIAVLGDDDDLLCRAVVPSLSGVVVPAEQIGIVAASMLDRLMRGDKIATTSTALEPSGVVSRCSTDMLAVPDPEVAAALQMIRSSAGRPLRVKEIADKLAISRRSLERKFQDLLQRTIGEEIARVHLEQAKTLLATSDAPVPVVAQRSGYGTPEYMATVIKKQTGMTPRQYRNYCQGR